MNDDDRPVPAEAGQPATPGGPARGRPEWSERGAALVEFALVLPILLTLVFGIIEYGRAYEVKVQLTGAVREGARALALGKTTTEAKAAVLAAAPGVSLTYGDVAIVSTCPAGGAEGNATVKIAYSLAALTPLVPSGSLALTATGVMRCGL